MTSWRLVGKGLIALAVLAAMGVMTVNAHKGAKGIIKQRMMAMKTMGDSMKELSKMVTGKAAFDAEKTKTIAATIKTHADDIPKQFPTGSMQKPTEALPAIWDKWDEFKGHADDLVKLAGVLVQSADTGPRAALATFSKMGKTCSGCHKDFRQKKD